MKPIKSAVERMNIVIHISTKIDMTIDFEEIINRVSKKSIYNQETITRIWCLLVKEMKNSVKNVEGIELEGGIRVVFDGDKIHE